jgi:glucose-6-phosphate-specific signal transduction histidine kinase
MIHDIKSGMLDLSFNFEMVWNVTSQLINSLFTVYLLPFGISLGLMLLGAIVYALRRLDLGRFQ